MYCLLFLATTVYVQGSDLRHDFIRSHSKCFSSFNFINNFILSSDESTSQYTAVLVKGQVNTTYAQMLCSR